MGAGHGHKLHYHAHSWLHRAPAHFKLVGLVALMLLVVAIPGPPFGEYGWIYAVSATLLFGLALSSTVPLRYLAKRMVVETPIVMFALLLPLVAQGPRVEVAGLTLSEAGLVGAATLLAKATLGVFAGLLLAATTEPQALLTGLAKLRLPTVLVEIMGFMIRYLDLVAEEWRRMSVARTARGFEPGNPRHWPILAKGLGSLFIRAYERGERVHLAMLARGHHAGGQQ